MSRGCHFNGKFFPPDIVPRSALTVSAPFAAPVLPQSAPSPKPKCASSSFFLRESATRIRGVPIYGMRVPTAPRYRHAGAVDAGDMETEPNGKAAINVRDLCAWTFQQLGKRTSVIGNGAV